MFSALLEYRGGQGLSRRGNKGRYASLVLVGGPDTKARQRSTGCLHVCGCMGLYGVLRRGVKLHALWLGMLDYRTLSSDPTIWFGAPRLKCVTVTSRPSHVLDPVYASNHLLCTESLTSTRALTRSFPLKHLACANLLPSLGMCAPNSRGGWQYSSTELIWIDRLIDRRT